MTRHCWGDSAARDAVLPADDDGISWDALLRATECCGKHTLMKCYV